MGWSPVVHLVHMGAELCELRSTADSTHTYQNTPKLCAAKCKCQNLLFCWEHVTNLIITDLIKLSTTAHLKIEWHYVTGGVLLNLFQLWTAAPVEAENAAGLRVFMRQRAALQCMAAAVYSDRHSVHNLCCYQMPWEEDSEWGSLIH